MAILIRNQQKKQKIDFRRIRNSLKKILKSVDCADKEVSILFTDDDGIREINKAYLNRDYPTNVMAFSMVEGDFKDVNPQIIGDIIISVETAYRHALNGDIDFLDELDFLMIHGLLHLLGYDHENTTTEKAAEMESLSNELFFNLKGYRLT